MYAILDGVLRVVKITNQLMDKRILMEPPLEVIWSFLIGSLFGVLVTIAIMIFYACRDVKYKFELH